MRYLYCLIFLINGTLCVSAQENGSQYALPKPATYKQVTSVNNCREVVLGKTYEYKGKRVFATLILKDDWSFTFLSMVEEGSTFAIGSWRNLNDSLIELKGDPLGTQRVFRDSGTMKKYTLCYVFADYWASPQIISRWVFVQRGDMLVQTNKW